MAIKKSLISPDPVTSGVGTPRVNQLDHKPHKFRKKLTRT